MLTQIDVTARHIVATDNSRAVQIRNGASFNAPLRPYSLDKDDI
jgi:hypothetical protein